MIRREIDLFWRFIKNDLWATIIPGLIITLAAISHTDFTVDLIITSLLKSFVYFVLYVYSFTLLNQLLSEKEDALNKPYRPLPSGLITKREVFYRVIMINVLFLVCGFTLGVIEWSVLWVVTHIFLNLVGHRHWISKNIIAMTFGIFSMIGAGWEMVLPFNSEQLFWAMVVSLTFGTCGVIQDFRDVEGDRLVRRKTISIDLGDKLARIVSIVFCITSFIAILNFIIIPEEKDILDYVLTIIVLFFFILICFRLLLFRTSKSDHTTYMILLYLFNFMLLSGAVYI